MKDTLPMKAAAASEAADASRVDPITTVEAKLTRPAEN